MEVVEAEEWEAPVGASEERGSHRTKKLFGYEMDC